jgi:PAS domain S-box-containing protein
MIRSLFLLMRRFLRSIFLPRTLRARIMLLIGVVNLAILSLTTIGVDLFVSRVESSAWRARQFEAARSAAQSIDAFLQRNQDALRWVDLLGYDELIVRPEILKDVLVNYPAFLEIVALDREGHTIAVAAQSKILLGNLFTTPQSEWFRKASADQEYYTHVQFTALDEPYLIYAMPIQNGGVMAARIKMDVLRRVVADIRFGKGGSVFVINQVGQVNAHTDPNIVIDNVSMSDNPEFAAIQQAPNREWYGQRWNFRHQRVVSVSTAVGQTGWTVITELPVSEAYAASRMIRVALPVGLLVILLATTGLIRHVLFQIFLKSVDRLRDGAARFGEGDLAHRIQIPRMDELGEVMAVFNQMAVRLDAQRFSLEQSRIQLQESERQYRLLAEHASDVIWLRDMNLRLLYTSPSELGLRGFTAEEAIQQTIDQTLTPASAAAAMEFFTEVLSQMTKNPARDWTKEARSLEVEVTRKDGSTVWTESRLVFLTDAEGKPTQILGVTRDISKRKKVEQELRRLNEQLEEHVSLRTAELSQLNANLLQEVDERKRTEKLLQALLEEKDVLLREVYHRVKNNLQIISSLLSLQTRTVTDPRILEVLNDSQNRVRSMALIHEKLYQSDNLAQVNFRDYLHSLVPSLLRSYHHSGGAITLQLEVEDTPIALELAIPCGLIVNELVTNALKYAFPGERNGTLRVELHQTADHLNLLRVADDGVGLPPGLDITHAQTLGLQLVNSLVAQVEGTLACERQNGTAFVISFRSL